MSKFHVGDRVRIQDRDGLVKQFDLDEQDPDTVYTIAEVYDKGILSGYDYKGQGYLGTEAGGIPWDLPEEILRPADIFAQVEDVLRLYDDERVAEAGNHQFPIADAVDVVNHPPHYNRFPVEVINITEQLDFNRGNAVKYLARAGFKEGVDELEDLSKAAWYVNRAIEKLTKERAGQAGKIDSSATPHVPYLDHN